MSSSTTIANSSVLVTGANRGLGRALLEEALRRGAKRVYAGTRQPYTHPDHRVRPLTLDITDPAQIHAAIERVDSLDVLVNNAGVAIFDELDDRSVLEQHLAVNLFGTWGMTEAFLPMLTSTGGAIVNVMSVAALATLPIVPSYSVSKAAEFMLTQSVRAFSAPYGVKVHAVLAGPMDTEMSREFQVPKASPVSVAGAIYDGVQAGDEEIFPDPMSATLAESWRGGAVKELERQMRMLVAPSPEAT
jgi:NAD(P)-dependent dehydrogenase (short-subunit alcohol dehydrogenase family)